MPAEKVDQLQVEHTIGVLVCPILSATFPVGATPNSTGTRVAIAVKSHLTACIGMPCAVYDRARSCCGLIARAPAGQP